MYHHRIALDKQTGRRYFYRTKHFHNGVRYTADCSDACLGKDATKPVTWHATIIDAHKAAVERGTLLVPS